MCYLLGVAVNRMFVRVRVFMESASLVEPQTGFRYIVWLPQIPENLRDVQAVSICSEHNFYCGNSVQK